MTPAFSDAGTPVQSVEPDWDAMESTPQTVDPRQTRLPNTETALPLLRLLSAGGASPKNIGQRTIFYCSRLVAAAVFNVLGALRPNADGLKARRGGCGRRKPKRVRICPMH